MPNLAQPWPVYSPAAARRVTALIESGAVFEYSNDGVIEQLEGAVRERYAAPYALSLNSGTSAIFAALAALGVEPGDEVVVAGWTFLAAVTPLLWLGATPVLADVAPGQPVADVESIVAVVTDRTKVVIVTHLFGEPVDTTRLRQRLCAFGILLLEDCSHAHASVVGNAPPGTQADAAIFSLGARKIVSGGHGGVLVTRSAEVYESALMVAHSKPRTRREFSGRAEAPYAELGLGGNLRMSPISAALALDHLERLDELALARVENAEVLAAALAPVAQPLCSTAPGENRTYFDLVFTAHAGVDATVLAAALSEVGIDAGSTSTRPLSRTIAALPASGAGHSGRYWSELSAWAGRVEPLPEMESLHDRSVSVRAETLYESGAPIARDFAARIERLLADGGAEWQQ